MKKIIFLLIIALIKLNAYEYVVFENNEAAPEANKLFFYTDKSGKLQLKRETGNGSIYDYNNGYYALDNIKRNASHWVNAGNFTKMYKENLLFLNDLYEDYSNEFLNYLYNPNRFTINNYITYKNYEILYNYDGLAVASIVEGKWAGLYNDDSKVRSGKLYGYDGKLRYLDGDYVGLYYDYFDFSIIPERIKEVLIIIGKISLGFVLGFAVIRSAISFSKYDAFKVRNIDYKKDYEK